MPRLVFKKGEHPPVEITGATVLGRSSEQAQIAIKDNRLSRAHCKFEPRDDGQWGIVDLGSQNGTFLNGRRVRESVLRPGDVVTIGTCDITFEAIGGPTGSDLMAGVASTRIGPSGSQKPVPDTGGGPAELALEENADDSSSATRTVVAPAALTLLQGTLKDKIFPLIKDVFTVGRKAGNDIVLEGDGKSSGQHARITRKDPATWVIEDLKSTNGVTVNGHKVVEPVVLKNGAKIVIGSQTFQFTIQGKPVETSGVTAPMSAKAVAGKLAEAGAAAPQEMTLDDEAIGSQSEKIDKAALNVEVRGGGKSSVIFSVIEVLLALAVVGGVLFGGWMMLQDERQGTGSSGGNPPPAEGGALKLNPSFEKVDAAGMPEGWGFDPRGGDALSMTDSAHGGERGVQLTRFSASNAVSYLASAPIKVESSGYAASVFALNSEAAADRFGTALLALLWHKDVRDPAFAVTPLAAASGLKTWTELKGSGGAPKDARWVRVAVGISGRSGSVVFDDAKLAPDEKAPAAFAGAGLELRNGLKWSVSHDCRVNLARGATVLLRDGTLALHQVEGRQDSLDFSAFLLSPPQVEQGEGQLGVRWKYFDPLAEKPVELRLDLGEVGSQATLVAVFAAGGAERASSQVTVNFMATAAFVPSELLRIEGGHVAEYKRELPEGDRRVPISLVLCADTGSGNRIEGINGTTPNFSARLAPGGRELFFQAQNGLQVAFSLGSGRDELRALAQACATAQAGQDPLERLGHAARIILEFPYNQQELTLAAAACESVATHFKLRHLELRDGINVPELTRNEGLYIAAMDESIQSAQKLREQSLHWSEVVQPALRLLEADSMNDVTKRAAKTAKAAFEELIQSALDFDELAKVAKKSRFKLRVAIEQRESRNLLLSAQDFLNSGLLTQGRIKLKYIIENYPRCAHGIAAKGLMVDQAEALITEAAFRQKDGLGRIAAQLKAQSREYLLLVEQNLLSGGKVLSVEERQWLNPTELGEDARSWMDMEAKLAERIRILRERLGN